MSMTTKSIYKPYENDAPDFVFDVVRPFLVNVRFASNVAHLQPSVYMEQPAKKDVDLLVMVATKTIKSQPLYVDFITACLNTGLPFFVYVPTFVISSIRLRRMELKHGLPHCIFFNSHIRNDGVGMMWYTSRVFPYGYSLYQLKGESYGNETFAL